MGRQGDVWKPRWPGAGATSSGRRRLWPQPLAQAPPTVARGSRGEGKELPHTCGILITCSSEDSSCHSDALWGAGGGGRCFCSAPPGGPSGHLQRPPGAGSRHRRAGRVLRASTAPSSTRVRGSRPRPRWDTRRRLDTLWLSQQGAGGCSRHTEGEGGR